MRCCGEKRAVLAVEQLSLSIAEAGKAWFRQRRLSAGSGHGDMKLVNIFKGHELIPCRA